MLRSTRSVQRSLPRDRESSSEERFHALDLRYPVCYRFVPNSEDAQICVCNRPLKLHGKEARQQQTGRVKLEKFTTEKQDRRNHIRFEQEAAYGRLINGALYARFDIKTNLETIENLLFDVWKLPTPKLIMSIIGGAKHFTLTDRLETNFINGIINVAIRSDIWMITSGYNNGLVQLVGQAIHKAKLRKPKQKTVAIAICKWGSVKNAKKLIKPKKNILIQNKADTSDTSDDEYDIEARNKYEHDLNMNHSHYLMLDAARHRPVDTKDYRTRLCRQLAKLDGEDDYHIPTVTVVVEGGDATISNIYNDLKSNIPVVIINGSGRVADFFSRWLLCTKACENDSKHLDPIYGIDERKSSVTKISAQQHTKKTSGRTDIQLQLHHINIDSESKILADIFSKSEAQIKQDLEKILYRDDDSNMAKRRSTNTGKKDFSDEVISACEKVMYCLQPSVRSNIFVFNLNSENDLSETIFRSIAKSYQKLSKRKKAEEDSISDNVKFDSKKNDKKERKTLLDLAMDWDCIDVAKEFVFRNSLENITDVEDTFKTALKKNLHTFVYEFIKLGLNPAEIFFPGNTFIKGTNRYKQFIDDLYNDDVVDDASTHLKSFIESDSATDIKGIDRTETLNAILRTLVGDYMQKLYFDSFDKEDEDRIKSGLTMKSIGTGPQKFRELENIGSLTIEEKNKIAVDCIMRDLFIWSILLNYTDMAKVFLSHMKYRICPALIATKILKQYHHKAAYGELKDGYKESAKYFEQYAIDCLDKCDDHNVDQACQIVLQRNELYGYVTCLQVAADAKDKLFIATSCCVEAMDNAWYDKLHPDQTRKRDRVYLFLGFISLGLVAPPLVTYRECKQGQTGETLQPTLRSCGINYCDPFPLEYPRYCKSELTINRYAHRVINFHQSLLMKFCYHFITYCFFLLLFSYFLLFNFEPPTGGIPSIHWTEILTIILVSCMLIEEVHYFFTQDSLTFFGRLRNYCRDLFKPMTLIAFILFYIGLIIRFTYTSSEEEFTAARVIMAIDIELWWLRFLSFIIVLPFLGPHLVAIGKMLKDLLFFICIIIIVMAGYGVASRSMTYYPKLNNFTTDTGGPIDTSVDGRSVFRQIAYPVYYFLHGEISGELANLDTNPNASWSVATHVLLAIHMLFVNILLTNLLIAMFSKRFDEVYQDTYNIWHSQQYLFTREYFTRAPFFPPISLFHDIYYLCRMFIFFIRRKFLHKSQDRNVKVFKMIPKNKSRIKEWYEFEGASTYEYAHAEVKASKAASAKSSSGQDSHNAENKENTMNNQKDSNDVLDTLGQVQEDVRKLNASIEGMKGEFNNSE